MYFLAFDAVVKKVGSCPLEFNSRSFSGKTNRDSMTLEFVRLVQLQSASDRKTRQISMLGKIEKGANSPEKRISSNFWTVPLKKASDSSKRYYYPKRPAPVFKMGLSATGLSWGIAHHDDWKKNFPQLLGGVKSNTPFTDLAILVMRNSELKESSENLTVALADNIALKFSPDLADFWIKQINAEKIFVRHANDPFQASAPNPLPNNDGGGKPRNTAPDVMRSLSKESLINRVIYLESLLDAQEIEYQSIVSDQQ